MRSFTRKPPVAPDLNEILDELNSKKPSQLTNDELELMPLFNLVGKIVSLTQFLYNNSELMDKYSPVRDLVISEVSDLNEEILDILTEAGLCSIEFDSLRYDPEEGEFIFSICDEDEEDDEDDLTDECLYKNCQSDKNEIS